MRTAAMSERITWHAALPIARRDDGAIVCGEAHKCPSPRAAVDCAAWLARQPGHIGAVAYILSGFPHLSWYDDAEILDRFGSV
jgi:hypothetical protein